MLRLCCQNHDHRWPPVLGTVPVAHLLDSAYVLRRYIKFVAFIHTDRRLLDYFSELGCLSITATPVTSHQNTNSFALKGGIPSCHPESVKPLFAKTRLEAMGGELYIPRHALDHSIGDGHQMVASVNSTKKKENTMKEKSHHANYLYHGSLQSVIARD